MNASGSDAAQPPVVLVVDDEPQIRAFLSLTLGDAGFSVRATEDGVAALALLRTCRPAVIITDLMMPRMDGWELCRRLRSASETASIPLVVISALRSADAPGDAFFPKPFDLDALLAALQRLIGGAAPALPQSCATGS
jgi:two-component system response regulator MprA